MQLDFIEAGISDHPGVKGENRENILKKFLTEKLPFQYGIGSGQIIFPNGDLSNQTDIILYDKLKCPILYAESSILVPIDGTHGIIEVKSALSKDELYDSVLKIQRYKENASNKLVTLSTFSGARIMPPIYPFGVVFAYNLKGNSLESLANNWKEFNLEVGYVNNWINMIFVLNKGYILLSKPKDLGEGYEALIDTSEMIQYADICQHNDQPSPNFPIVVEAGEDTLTKFYLYLSYLLARTPVMPVDIGEYFDLSFPPIIHHTS